MSLNDLVNKRMRKEECMKAFCLLSCQVMCLVVPLRGKQRQIKSVLHEFIGFSKSDNSFYPLNVGVTTLA